MMFIIICCFPPVLTFTNGGNSLPFPIVACEVSISMQFVAMVTVVHCLGSMTVSPHLDVSIFRGLYFRAEDCCSMIVFNMNVAMHIIIIA